MGGNICIHTQHTHTHTLRLGLPFARARNANAQWAVVSVSGRNVPAYALNTAFACVVVVVAVSESVAGTYLHTQRHTLV